MSNRHTGRVHRRVSSPELIGRAAELATLGAAMTDARHGHGRLVVVEGDAGIGKTRLVEQFTSQADGVRVLAGGGIPLASDIPYAPLIAIFQVLARLHPPAADMLLPRDQPTREDQFGLTRLLGVAAEAVRAAAAEMPVMLVVEDLHWADGSTRELVSFLARVIRAEPVLLVVTVRTEELDPARPVTVLTGEMARLPHAQRLVLAPLDTAGVAAQVRGITGVAPSAEMVRRLVERAAGNPFFTEELLAAGTSTSALPTSVREVLLTRVVRLPEAGQRVLRAAAAVGRTVPHALLAAVADAADLEDGLAAVVGHRLLESHADAYQFRHPLIQETVYAELLPATRHRLHARAAAALAAMRPPATLTDRAGRAVQTAFHWRAAGETGKAVAASVRAGDLARAAHAPAEALAQYTQALAAWEEASSTTADLPAAAGVDEVTLMERAAEAASAAGDNAGAQELAQQVLARIDPIREPVRAALRLERLGRFSWIAGDLHTSWRAYEDALRVMPDRPSVAQARVLAATAQYLMLRCRYLASRGYADQAAAVAQNAAVQAEVVHARNTLGTDLIDIGCHAEGIAMITSSSLIARQIGDETEIARCYVNLTSALVRARRVREAVRVGNEGIREVTALGFGRSYASAVLGNVLDALYLLGQWDEIESRAGAALDFSPEPRSTINWSAARCQVALARGDLIAADGHAALTTLPGSTHDPQHAPVLSALQASVAAARGDLTTARIRVGDALDLIDETDDILVHLQIAGIAVRIEADALDAALLTGRRADPAAARHRAERVLATAHNAMTRVIADGGSHTPIFALLDTLARAQLSRVPGPADPDLWEAVATDELADVHLVAYARLQQATALLARKHDRREAADLLRDADETARRLHAEPLRTDIDTLARRARIDLAESAPPRRQPDPDGLTPREREVITLLGDGLSNAEIAKTLYISEKTASVHVSNILRKLGVTSRLQAAAAARVHGAPEG
jgi:DNA-binding CsgD family transcriptional regulator